LQGAHLLITGGTGFWGAWLLETLLWAADRRKLTLRVEVLTRDPAPFAARQPHLANHPCVRLLKGDVTRFEASAPYTHVIHAATDASLRLVREVPLATFDTIVQGTRAVLEAARPGRARVLLASSGAVYGVQPPELTHLPEDFRGAPDPFDVLNVYGEGKRAAEMLGASAARAWGVPVVVARGFAFVGPHLPLGRHFAVGNFLADALAGGPVRVAGDGTPWRSYMYAADMAVWLWTMLLRGSPGVAYNVGSEEAVTIRQVAECVGDEAGVSVHVAGEGSSGAAGSRYVPCTRLARETLGLSTELDLQAAIRRTLAWHRGHERG
jgi:dTDP-glucose 4,6-dehydratase